jgi:circadian clock protein KaiC
MCGRRRTHRMTPRLRKKYNMTTLQAALAPVLMAPRIATGITGLDEILCGGLTKHRVYLVEGTPGTGKTTVALQFLLEGLRQGESGLYITLSETREELRAVAASHGWSLDGLTIFELSAETSHASMQSIFNSAEIELGETINDVMRCVEDVKPMRLAFDSLSELRLLAQSSLLYRRQILVLKQFFSPRTAPCCFLMTRAPVPVISSCTAFRMASSVWSRLRRNSAANGAASTSSRCGA